MKIGLRRRQRGSDAFVVVGGSGKDASRGADECQQF